MGRARTHIGAALVTVGGIAYALIQILQSSVGAFNPRPLVTLLIAVCVGLIGATLVRLRHYMVADRAMAEVVRVWPPRTLDESDPLSLGVFPARLPGPYVPRDADGALQVALRGGGLVLLFGPPRSGKSRTALEGARGVLGSRPVLIPADGAALSALAADPPTFRGAGTAVWWLDDLERFVDHLGAGELSLLADDGRTVVITVREDTWHSLLQSAGDAGECGRRLLGAAGIVRVSQVLSASEASAAQSLYPGLDVDGGIGSALSCPDDGAAAGRISAAAAAAAARRRDPLLMLALTAMIVAIALLAVVVVRGGFATVEPPPIGAQVDTIRYLAARGGATTILAMPASLHGGDASSEIFVMRPPNGSDQLRIYDDEGGRLRLKVSFQPFSQHQSGSDYAVAPQIQQRQAAIDYQLTNPQVVDAFGDGEHELIDDFSPASTALQLKLPIMVAWDDAEERYKLSPLLAVQPPKPPGGAHRDAYLKGPYILQGVQSAPGALSSSRLSAYAVSVYRVLPAGPDTPALLAIGGDASDVLDRPLLAVDLYTLSLSDGRPATKLTCSGVATTTLVPVSNQAQMTYAGALDKLAPTLAGAVSGIASGNGNSCVD